jgi:hypothetical protein
MSPARRRGQDAAPNRRNDLDRVEHRHTINTGGTAAKPTTNIKINNNSYTENLTGSDRRLRHCQLMLLSQMPGDGLRAGI